MSNIELTPEEKQRREQEANQVKKAFGAFRNACHFFNGRGNWEVVEPGADKNVLVLFGENIGVSYYANAQRGAGWYTQQRVARWIETFVRVIDEKGIRIDETDKHRGVIALMCRGIQFQPGRRFGENELAAGSVAQAFFERAQRRDDGKELSAFMHRIATINSVVSVFPGERLAADVPHMWLAYRDPRQFVEEFWKLWGDSRFKVSDFAGAKIKRSPEGEVQLEWKPDTYIFRHPQIREWCEEKARKNLETIFQQIAEMQG